MLLVHLIYYWAIVLAMFGSYRIVRWFGDLLPSGDAYGLISIRRASEEPLASRPAAAVAPFGHLRFYDAIGPVLFLIFLRWALSPFASPESGRTDGLPPAIVIPVEIVTNDGLSVRTELVYFEALEDSDSAEVVCALANLLGIQAEDTVVVYPFEGRVPKRRLTGRSTLVVDSTMALANEEIYLQCAPL